MCTLACEYDPVHTFFEHNLTHTLVSLQHRVCWFKCASISNCRLRKNQMTSTYVLLRAMLKSHTVELSVSNHHANIWPAAQNAPCWERQPLHARGVEEAVAWHCGGKPKHQYWLTVEYDDTYLCARGSCNSHNS